jgi:methanogen extracellular protein (TIGR04279 family)/PGF-CTERM protein/uncharacterized repeat protein (TIGR01451 family)
LKESLLIIVFGIFILTSATAIARDDNARPYEIPNGTSFSSINFTDQVVYILNHTSDPSEGNWITMGSPYEERRIQLPQPITIKYSGPKFGDYKGVSWNLSSSNDRNYIINYPSTSSYTTLPVYLPGEKVNMSFFGASALEGKVDIYVFNATSKSAYGILDAFNTGNIENLDSLFHKNMDGNYKNYSAVLGENGDLLDYNLGSFDPGQYCIVMIQKNEDGSLTVLSTTVFMVSEYELKVSAPASIEKGKNLDINMELEGATDNSNYTYGAVLINEQAYKANIEINSNGTINNTSVLVNGVHFTDKFDINLSNYKSKLTKNELQNEIQTSIGKGNGSIAIGEKGLKKLSLTTFDLPTGKYYLFVGAYRSGKGLVGFTQVEVDITLPIEQNADYDIFKSVIGPDENGDCIVNSPGDIIPYRIVIKNDGNVDLTGVSVSDPIVKLTEPTGDDIDPGVLNLGEVWEYTGDYRLTQNDINNGKGYIDNTATVSCNELPDKTSSIRVPIEQNAELQIYKSVIGIDEAGDYIINNPGDVINYQVAVKNNGHEDLTGVSVDDPMITLTKNSGDYNDPGVLNPGETWIYKGDYTVTQSDIDNATLEGSGFITNTATVHCNELPDESSSIQIPIVTVSNTQTDTITTPDNISANGSEPQPTTTNVQPTPSSNNGESNGGSSRGGGGSSGSANAVSSSSSTTNTTATPNVTPTVTNTPGLEQTSTSTNVQTPEPTATSTPAKQSKKTPGFEIVSGVTALLGAIYLFRRR